MKIKLNLLPGSIKEYYRNLLNMSGFHPGPAIVSIVLCIITVIVVVNTMTGETGSDLREFEAGKVADRDVVAGYEVSYIDEDATRIRKEAQERLVPAVFGFSNGANAEILNSWNSFCDFTDGIIEGGASAAAARLAVQAEYPAYFNTETLDIYFNADERLRFRDFGIEVLDNILKQGIFHINKEELKNFNPDTLELITPSLPESLWQRLSYRNIVTIEDAGETLGKILENTELPDEFKAVGTALLRPFINENVFFSPRESQNHVFRAGETVTPVIRTIEKGSRIIRRGFIISEIEMRDLRTYYTKLPGRDPRNVIGLVFLILSIYMLFALLRSDLVLGKKLNISESYLFSALICFYIIGPILIKSFFPVYEGFPVSLAFPTALLVMILAAFMGVRTAMIMAIALPLAAYLAGVFDNSALIIALISGVTASMTLQNAQKRMDLIKAGLIIAAANCLAVVVVLLLRRSDISAYPLMLFWAALNGIISGMLILGILPPLEQALNAVTTFRLIELADLNAPILRKLFTNAPGTYSHSIMVANMAEQACQDIGANALLARVGAYYHDIGKMENPGYFVENQTDHNKHDDITPRLSATVIRSHVKLGIEKARSLGLPSAVISIIGEHHGNSLISWFYNKAMEQEEQVNTEDFIYMGNPPCSKESAAVMLADVTEAAVRTLTKPTVAKMEKFIQGLFDAKVEHGQLAKSDLTFRELETIKNAFVKVLAGYYHSRIEYPNQKEEEAK